MSLSRIALSFAVVALAVAAHADVHVVSPTGPYTEIQDAVDVALDGDVVLVKAGTYSSFSVRNIDLSIVAEQGAAVEVQGAIRVSGVGAARTLLLSGLSATGTTSANPSSRFGLVAHNCAGTLLVQDCVLRGGTGQGPCGLRADGVELDQCQNAIFVRCTLRGADEYVDWNTAPGEVGTSGFGASFASSRVALYNSILTGGNGEEDAQYDCQSGYGYDSSDGGHGCFNASSFLFASASTLRGGDGARTNPACPQGPTCLQSGGGGNGIAGTSGAALAPQWLATTALGGSGGAVTPCTIGCGQPHYFGGNGVPSSHTPAPAVLPGSARPMTTVRLAREGALVTFNYSGGTGEAVELHVSSSATLLWSPATRGTLVPRRRGASAVQLVGTLPGSGVLSQAVTIGDLGPQEEARRVIFQPLFIAPSGVATLGTPQAIVLLDSAF